MSKLSNTPISSTAASTLLKVVLTASAKFPVPECKISCELKFSAASANCSLAFTKLVRMAYPVELRLSRAVSIDPVIASSTSVATDTVLLIVIAPAMSATTDAATDLLAV